MDQYCENLSHSVYLDTCPKNDVISFSRKSFVLVLELELGFGLGLNLGLELAEIPVRFRSNVHSGKCTRAIIFI